MVRVRVRTLPVLRGLRLFRVVLSIYLSVCGRGWQRPLAAGGTFDRLNNVEQILIRSPITGRYDISVIGESIPGDGSALSDRQGYALVVSAAAPPAPVIAAPGNVTASVAGTSGIEIDFDAVAGAERYNIYRAEGDCSAETLDFSHVGQTTGTSFVDTRTIGGFDYSYRVRADDGAMVNGRRAG